MGRPFRIAAIGELLWDLLPDGLQLGGATANFASLSANFTETDSADLPNKVFLISRVGNDSLGRLALEQLGSHHVISDFISIDATHRTGIVTVTLRADAGPKYKIHEDVAWDFIPDSISLSQLAPTLDAICFGTLAQRSPVTRETVRSVVEVTRPDCIRVFDVNLRRPYWTAEMLQWGCAHATILKMSEEEAQHVAHAIDPTVTTETPVVVAHFLLQRFPVKLIAITRGAGGCLLVTREAICDRRAPAANLVDSIGAGDAFTAALTYMTLHQMPLPVIAEAANYWGAWVASQRGGMPLPDEKVRRECKLSIGAVQGSANFLE